MDNYNRQVLIKVKDITDDLPKTRTDEESRRAEIEKKCQDFLEDVRKKFDSEITTEKIIEENESLRSKLKEYNESTQVIKQNLEDQLSLKDKQSIAFEEDFKTQITDKLSIMSDDTTRIVGENKELRCQISVYQKKFEEMTSTLSKFSSSFDLAKKEYERVSI